MPDEITKADVLEALRAEHSQWENLLAEVGAARMTTPILASWWTVKDIITHITWYERQTTEALQADTGGGRAREWLWELTADKRNAFLYTEYRDQPLAEARAATDQAFAQLVATVEALSEQEIRNPRSFPNMPPGWHIWHFIARHSYEHYRQHRPAIRAWLDTLAPATALTNGHLAAAGVSLVPVAAL